MRIYISGAIKNRDITVAEQHFEQAERLLRNRGHEVVNPMKLPHKHGQTWEEYMLEDIAELFECSAIYMLQGWQGSDGAQIEHFIAGQLDKQVEFE